MATERRDEESGSPRNDRTGNTETDSPPQTTGKTETLITPKNMIVIVLVISAGVSFWSHSMF